MTKQNVKVHAGKLFCLSSGEYSDYGYEGHFLALMDITNDVLTEAKNRATERAKVEPNSWGKIPGPDEDWLIRDAARSNFIPELVRMGAVLDIDCTEIHLGSYGNLEWS